MTGARGGEGQVRQQMMQTWRENASAQGDEVVQYSAAGDLAIFSPCMQYRYMLTREINPEPGDTLGVIMVNPSTADAFDDDQTIRKVMGFASRWGAHGVIVCNLFAYRATDVRHLKYAPDPVGSENDRHIQFMLFHSRALLCAWGREDKHRAMIDRKGTVLSMAREFGVPTVCIAKTPAGAPWHPLMARYTDRPLAYGPDVLP